MSRLLCSLYTKFLLWTIKMLDSFLGQIPQLISGTPSVYLAVFLEKFEMCSTDSSRGMCDLPEGLNFGWLF